MRPPFLSCEGAQSSFAWVPVTFPLPKLTPVLTSTMAGQYSSWSYFLLPSPTTPPPTQWEGDGNLGQSLRGWPSLGEKKVMVMSKQWVPSGPWYKTKFSDPTLPGQRSWRRGWHSGVNPAAGGSFGPQFGNPGLKEGAHSHTGSVWYWLSFSGLFNRARSASLEPNFSLS